MFPTDSLVLETLLRVLILGPLGLIWVVIIVRMIGLRTFSKMTSFDFVATIATGSLLANIATSNTWPAFWQASGAMGAILLTQMVLAMLRSKSSHVREALENNPIVLFSEGRWDEEALNQTRTTKTDIWGKMREANVLKIESVRSIVLETTGDVSVLHGDVLEPIILSGVTGKSDYEQPEH